MIAAITPYVGEILFFVGALILIHAAGGQLVDIIKAWRRR